MRSIEELVNQAAALQAADGLDRNALELISDRLYLAISPKREPELFIRGTRESFPSIDGDRILTWGEYRLRGSGTNLPALVVRTAEGSGGQRLIAHVAYEANRLLEANPIMTNAALIEALHPFLRLVVARSLLSPTDQIGLTGELIVLSELLALAVSESQRRAALGGWTGPQGGRRDFYFDGLASIEVKSGPGNSFSVGLDQLLPVAGDGDLFLGTVQVRRDGSAPLKLPDVVTRVENLLGLPELVEAFRYKLRRVGELGYNPLLAGEYRLEPGFFVEPVDLRRLHDSNAILRKGSFREGEPPASVSQIHYSLDVSGMPQLSQLEKKAMLTAMLGT